MNRKRKVDLSFLVLVAVLVGIYVPSVSAQENFIVSVGHGGTMGSGL